MTHQTNTTGMHNNANVPFDGTTANTATPGLATRPDESSSARPHESLAQKLKGNAEGALHTTVGSVQALAGATFRNEKLEQQGLEKMHAEDKRLASKHGLKPVGTGLREKALGEPSTEEARPQQ
ncbi:hypothetical protein BX600DRAFT_461180 [Xylariales sp. PMI_506]|nr:hypothetical protein BX600DRAFT_461180 [Xylariales sp. PMI_506]